MTNTSTLRDLTQTVYDSVDGYRNAMEKADSPVLRNAFENRLTTRQQTLTKLNTALTNNGEQPIASASTIGAGHQVWLKIVSAFENNDEAAVEHVETGEDYLVDQFEKALKDNDIDVAQRRIIEDAYNEVREGERFTDMLEKQYS